MQAGGLNITIADSQGVGTITNDDSQPTVSLSLSGSPLTENGGHGTVTATLSNASYQDVTVDLAFSGTAALTTDYTRSGTQIVIAAGQTSGSITLTSVHDTLDENNETIIVDISGVTNGSESGTQQVTATITDDDNQPTVSIADAAGAEGDSVGFVISLSAASGKEITVGYATQNGSAVTTGGSGDFTPVTSGSVVFNPGETSKLIYVSTTEDSLKEMDETFYVNLNSYTNVTPADTSGQGVIVDDDATGVTSIDQPIYCDCMCSCQESAFKWIEQTGNMIAGYYTPSGLKFLSSSTTVTDTLVAIETVYPQDSSVPTLLLANFSLGGQSATPVYYNLTGVSAGDPLRFVFQVDTSSLASGTYDWELDLSGSTMGQTSYRTLSGSYEVVNRSGSAFGSGWWMNGLDSLIPNADGSVMLLKDNGAATTFEPSGGGNYTTPAGYFSTLVKHGDNTYTLTQDDGTAYKFSSSGNLTEIIDTNGNSSTYTWQSGKLTSFTDPTGRTTTLAYSSGKLDTITDPYGRVTDFTINGSGQVTSITNPDPDGVGPLSAPVTTYEYDGTSGLIESITDAAGKETLFTYTFAQRLSGVEYADESTIELDAVQMQGLPDTGSGQGTQQNPFAIISPDEAIGTFTDALENEATFQTDRFGNHVSYTDALGKTTLYVRNADGQVTSMTQPDPDGAGPLGQPVTEYEYTDGNLTEVTLPDESTQEWTYDSTFNQVTSFTDELGRLTLFEIDEETGNILSVTQVVGEIDDEINQETDDVTLAAYTYTAAPASAGDLPGGLLLTVTDALGRVTEYEWQDDFQSLDFGRLLSVTRAAGTADEAAWTYGYDSFGNVNTLTDPLGRTTVHEYDRLNRLIELTQPDPDSGGPLSAPVWTWEYDAAGNVLVETDPLGNETAYEYDDRGLLVEITYADPDGGGALAAPVVEFDYNAAGWLIGETDALGNVTAYEYNDLGWLLELTQPDPDGGGGLAAPVWAWTHDALGNVLTETDPLGGVTSHDYDARSRRIETALPDPDAGGGQTSPVYSWEYDAAGQLVSQTDALGRETTYEYDVFARLVEMTLPDPDGGGGQAAPVWSFEYDAVGNLTAETNPLDETVDMEYDNLNRLVLREKVLIDSEYGPFLRQQEEWDYDDAGQVTQYENFLGKLTSYDYDNLGRLIEATLPDPDGGGAQTSPVYAFEYDAIGNVLVEIDALGNETAHDYDNLHRLVSSTLPDPDGGGGQSSPVWQFAYNANGWLTKVTDPLSRETTYTLDNLGRRTKTTMPDPDGGGGQAAAEYTVVYDAASNVVSETNPLGKTTNYDYDALHRLIETQLPDPDGGGALGRPTTTFEYDAASNLLSLTDPVDNTTEWVYDGLDRVVEETNSLAASRTYSYDALNRVVEYTDRRGLVTQFDYDFWGRLVEETWLDGVTTINTLEYRYDLANNLLEADDDASAFDFSYDNLSRLLTSVDASGGPTVRLSQTWDSNSNRAALEAEIDSGGGYAADFLNEYTWDNLSRMTRVEQSDSGAGGVDVAEKRVDFAYNAVNQFTTITRYEDLAGTDLVATSSYGYDLANRLTGLTHAKGQTTLADYDWTYDVASRVTSFTYSLYSAETATYSYDHTDQLTRADRSGSGSDEAYSFDVNGNPTDSGWTVDDDNLLTSDGTYNYAHDDEGNTTRRTNISTGAYVDYFYDHRNRLVKAEFRTSGHTLTKRVELEYDVFDRLILKRLDANGNGSFERYERFVYDGNNLVLAFVDLDGQGSGDDFTLGNRYLHGPAVDQLMADEQFDASEDLIDTYWTLGDNLGSIRDIANYTPGTDSTAVVNHRAFDSFGELLSETPSAPTTRFYFTGRYFDHDLQLQYNHHRWYDPQQRRWMTKDPIGFAAGDTNTSRMVGNDPVNFFDSIGLEKTPFNYTGNDAVIAKAIQDAVDEMQPAMDDWTPDNPADSGAFGKEVERRVGEKLRGKQGWYLDVCVDPETNTVLAVGDRMTGTRKFTQVDAIKVKKGVKVDVGMVLRADDIEDLYEMKGSLSGTVEASQIEKLKRVKAGGDAAIASSMSIQRARTPVRYTSAKGWENTPGFGGTLMRTLSILGGTATLYGYLTAEVDAGELGTLARRSQEAAGDEQKMREWIYFDLAPFLSKYMPKEAVYVALAAAERKLIETMTQDAAGGYTPTPTIGNRIVDRIYERLLPKLYSE